MKVFRFAVVVLVGIAGAVFSANGQQKPTVPNAAECTTGMSTKECEVSRLDALFKKFDRAKNAEAHGTLMYRYVLAIQSAVMRNWLRPDGIPHAQCEVHIVQLPGGKVASAVVDPSCPYDGAGRRSVVNAVLRTETLPYRGFESVFQSKVTLVFMPWLPDDRRAQP